MSSAIHRANLADRLTDLIDNRRVRAALFSTFTFGREFFERVPLSLITGEGRHRGQLPITVIVDRTRFTGGGWGYDVVRAPAGRLWHAKLVALMVESGDQRGSVIAIGSGNLTSSGWERSLELFKVDAWRGWRLPGAVLDWLRTPWMRESAFAKWARRASVRERSRQHESVLGSYLVPLWDQLHLLERGARWSEAHVVSPFGDVPGSDGDSGKVDPGPFFAKLLDHAASNDAVLTVHLRSEDEKGRTAFASAGVLAEVGKRVRLRLRAVPSENGRLLHAKLLALRSRGSWSVVLGSPNATGAAFVDHGANVELAHEFRRIGRTLPRALLPPGRTITLDALRPPMPWAPERRWECLEEAVYHPRHKRIVLHWKPGHGHSDSRVLLEGRELGSSEVDLGAVSDRFVVTLPRRPGRKNYAPDFVPIRMPDQSLDVTYDRPLDEMTAEEWLEWLALPESLEETYADAIVRLPSRRTPSAAPGPDGFPWRERVLALERSLRGFEAAIKDARTEGEVEDLCLRARGVWQSHDPSARGLPPVQRAWRSWVRAGLAGNLPTRSPRDLAALRRRWTRQVAKELRELDVWSLPPRSRA